MRSDAVAAREKTAAVPPAKSAPPAKRATSTVEPASEPLSPRRFEMAEGASSKFWELWRDGCSVTVRFGRLGTAGQSKTKDFASEELARRHALGLVAEKLAKGYHESGGSQAFDMRIRSDLARASQPEPTAWGWSPRCGYRVYGSQYGV